MPPRLWLAILTAVLSLPLGWSETACADEKSAGPTNIALPQWGTQVRGTGQEFNRIYEVENAADGTGTPTIFGSKPRGLVGGSITFTLALSTQLSELTLRQAKLTGTFARAREVELSADGKQVGSLTLEDAPGQVQRFPLDVRALEFSVTVVSQYGDAAAAVGGWEEIELYTAEDLEAKFALPETFKPGDVPLIQSAGRESTVGSPFQATGHPRTLWSAEELDEARQRLARDPTSAGPAGELVRRADALLLARLTPPAASELVDAASSDRHVANAASALDLALAAALTGERRYADKAAAILEQYASAFSAYSPTAASRSDSVRMFNRQTELAAWTIQMALAYDLLHGHLSAQQREAIARDLLHPAALCVGGRPQRWPLSDTRGVMAAATTLVVGYATDSDELVRLGLEGRDKKGGLWNILGSAIADDGTWPGRLVAPPDIAAEAMVLMAECAWRNGLNLYERDGSRLKRLLDAPLEIAYPNHDLPSLYPDGPETLLFAVSPAYEYAMMRYADPRYRLIVEEVVGQAGAGRGQILPGPIAGRSASTASLSPIVPGAALLPSAGLGAARIGAGTAAAQMLLVCGPRTEDRSADWRARRYDALAIDLWGLGRRLLVSPGGSYSDYARLRRWYRSSIAHNTLVADERRQAPGRAQPVIVGATDRVAILRARTDKVYPGVALDRTIILHRDYAIDLMAVFSSTLRTFDMAYHGPGMLKTPLKLQERARGLGGRPGYSEMTDIAMGQTSEAWWAAWFDAGGGSPLIMTFPSGEQTTVATAVGWMGSGRAPLVLQRRRTRQTAFAAAISLSADRQFVSRVSWIETADPSLRALKVGTRRGTDYLFVRYAPGTTDAEPIRSNADIVFLSTTGQTRDPAAVSFDALYVAGGTFTEVMGVRITSSQPALLALEAQGNGNWVIGHLAGQAGQEAEVSCRGLRLDGRTDSVGPRLFGYPWSPLASQVPTSARAEIISEKLVAVLPPGMCVEAGPAASAVEASRTAAAEAYRTQVEQVRASRQEAMQKALRNEAEAARQSLRPGTVVIIEAEAMAAQEGGSAESTEKKVGARGKALWFWDEEGHWLQWDFEIPESGWYQVLVKYCTRNQRVRRHLEIDGRTAEPIVADFHLPFTGGWSNNQDDWRLVQLEDWRLGRRLLLYLTKGKHTLRMTNLSQSANLDYIVLASPDVPADRAEFE